MEVTDSNDISSESMHQICSQKLTYTPGESLLGVSTKVVKRIVKFEISILFGLFFFGPFNTIVKG